MKSKKVTEAMVFNKSLEVDLLKLELEKIKLENEIAECHAEDVCFGYLDFSKKEIEDYDDSTMEIELDLLELLEILEQEDDEDDALSILSYENLIEETNEKMKKFLDTTKFGIEEYGAKDEMSDPYDENYFYVIIPDLHRSDGVFTILERNNEDVPVLYQFTAKNEDAFWNFIQGEDSFLFTEKEIMKFYPYLWKMRIEAR